MLDFFRFFFFKLFWLLNIVTHFHLISIFISIFLWKKSNLMCINWSDPAFEGLMYIFASTSGGLCLCKILTLSLGFGHCRKELYVTQNVVESYVTLIDIGNCLAILFILPKCRSDSLLTCMTKIAPIIIWTKRSLTNDSIIEWFHLYATSPLVLFCILWTISISSIYHNFDWI